MKLCVALDMQTKSDNLALAREIRNCYPHRDIWLKVGLSSFIRDGRDIIHSLQAMDFRIFLDLKLYDIPNTMIHAIKECHNIGIDMITIHASSGYDAMHEIYKLKLAYNMRMLVIAVSVLTSFDNEGCYKVYNNDIATLASRLANLVHDSKLDGLVCSLQETEIIKAVSKSLLVVTPGIRLDTNTHDQKRVANVAEAKRSGSDFIVVGRPIYEADDRGLVIDRILNDINHA